MDSFINFRMSCDIEKTNEDDFSDYENEENFYGRISLTSNVLLPKKWSITELIKYNEGDQE